MANALVSGATTTTGTMIVRTASASSDSILSHLTACSESFIPPLHSRVNLVDYSRKLVSRSVTFEGWQDDIIVCLVAAYFNDRSQGNRGFITSVSTIPSQTGRGYCKAVMLRCFDYAREHGFAGIDLEVNRQSLPAITLYRNLGFVPVDTRQDSWLMRVSFDDLISNEPLPEP